MRSVRVGERLDIVLISAPLCSDRAEMVDSRKDFHVAVKTLKTHKWHRDSSSRIIMHRNN